VSKLSKNGLMGTLLIVAFMFSASPALSQATVKGQESQIVLVRDLLSAGYPDLLGKDRFLTISVSQSVDSSWSAFYAIKFEVTPLSPEVVEASKTAILLDPKTGNRVPPPPNPPILRGEVRFDSRGRIWWLSVMDEDELNTKKNEDIEKLIQSHPEWSNAKDYEELKKAGALYGPKDKDEFLRSIHLERFEKFFGHLEIKSVDPPYVSDDRSASFVFLGWGIVAEAKLPDGSTRTYLFVFEPFGGRLTLIQHVNRP
jgi:hypothetical protein